MRTKTVFLLPTEGKKLAFLSLVVYFLSHVGDFFTPWAHGLILRWWERQQKRRGTTHVVALCLFFFTRICQNPFLRRPAFFCAKTRLLLLPLQQQHASRLEGLFTQLDSSRKISKSAHTVHPVRRIRDEQKSPPKSHDGGKMICGSQIHTDCKEHL